MGAENIKQLSLAKTTGQSLLSLVSGLGDIFAGLILATYLAIFPSEPWIIALYPGILSMRGVIGGLFAGRLSTGLHLGIIKAKVFGEDTKSLHLLQGSIVVLTFSSSILLGFVALLFGVAFWEINIFSGLTIFSTLIATMGLSLLAISPITVTIAFSFFKKGLDPDIIVYPIVSTLADVLVTLCYVLVLSMSLLISGIGQLVVLVICIVFTCLTLVISYQNRSRIEFARTLKEAIYAMIFVAFIVNITGSVLSRIRSRSEVYIVYPALLNVIGGFGAIVGATATTKLALGTIGPSLKSIRSHRNQILGAWIALLVMCVIIALISSFYQVPPSFFAALKFVGLLLATGVFASIFMIFISFNVAILAFQKGLDPDNFVIPIESSLADTITTVALLAMLSLVG